MEQRVSLITLGSHDLERTAAFYTALGWEVTAREGSILVFNLTSQALSFYLREDFAEETGLDFVEGPAAISLAHNVRDKAEVALLLAAAEAAGGRIVKPAADMSWGGRAISPTPTDICGRRPTIHSRS